MPKPRSLDLRSTLPVVLALLFGGATSLLGGEEAPPAQGEPGPAAAAADLRSPEVSPEGRVTFRIRAPKAEKVLVTIEGSPPMAMSQEGPEVWSVTTDPLAPDFYPYFFIVDGLPRWDAANPLGKAVVTGGRTSIVHVPGPPSLPWEENDVPHGAVHRHVYRSEAIGEEREYFVYTPPGYDPSGGREYPVLYLLHGVTSDAGAWTTAGRAHVLLDNLIARGEAKPMLMVHPLGYGFPGVAERMWEVINDPGRHLASLDVLAASLLAEILPQVEGAYRVAKDRESRAIAGFSMGGSQALYIGFRHLDRFAWIGSFGAALPMFPGGFDKAFPALGAADNERLRLLWVACGSGDFLLTWNRGFKDWLEAKGVRFTWAERPGGHTWMLWRRNLAELAPLLFAPRP